jgi:hypothetical protein
VPDAATAQPDGTAEAGVNPVCTAKSPVQATDLAGKWAWKTVASRFEPATGFVSAFYTRTISILLAEQTQTGADVTASVAYCDQYNEDPDALVHVIIPDAYKRILKPLTAHGVYDGDLLRISPIVEVVGAHLTDPATEALPTDPTDPRLFDEDGDGKPGVTIKVQGLGDAYVTQRTISQPLLVAVSQDRLEGHFDYTSEQVIVDSLPTTIKALAGQKAIVDPNACASTFTAVRVAAASTCADIAGDAGSPF